MSLSVSVLGELEVSAGGRPVDLGGPKPRALVALLVAGEGRPVPVVHLIDQMWADAPPTRVEVSLQSYVARLRKSFAAVESVGRNRLRTHPGGYALDLSDAEVDVRRFEHLLRTARDSTDEAARLGGLTAALDLWRGRPYAEFGCPALEAEATRLEEMRLFALEQVWDLRLRRGEHAEVVAALELMTRTQPLHEQWWALLARALYAAHRQGDALAALRRAREHLAAELGVDPGPELRRVEEAVLRHDPSLDVPAVSPVPSHGTRVSAGRRPAGPAVRGGAGARDPDPPPPVGRGDAVGLLQEVLGATAAGHGQVMVVAGEPGVGKTHLLDHVASLAAGRGLRVGRGGWEDEGAPSLWGWRHACAELLGGAAVLDAGGSDATTASFRQAESLLAAVDKLQTPVLVVLDDVHWADADSLRLLRRVAAEIADVPLAVLVGVRAAGHELLPVVADTLVGLARSGAVRVDLTGLAPDDVQTWVGDTTGLTVTPDVARRLVSRTGGNPFFVSELVRLLVAEGALTDPSARAWDAVPTGVRDVVRHRLARLDPQVEDVARTAAVAGRVFDHAVVAGAAGVGLEVVEEAVEALHAVGLVEEESPGRSRFTHALARDAVHGSLGPTVRARAHGAVALALEAHHVGRVASHAAELAEHYRLAGPTHARAAWLFATTAAEQAAGQAAHDDALRWWRSAEESQVLDPEAEPVDRERLLLGRARALIRLGRALESWEPCAVAASSAMARGDVLAAAAALLTVTEELVWGWRLHPFYDEDAIALWREVRDALEGQRGDGVLAARLTAGLAHECFFHPDLAEESTRLADEAIGLVRESTSDPRARLDVIQLAFIPMLGPDHLDRALALYDEMVGLASRTGEVGRLATVLCGRASALGERWRLDDARSDVARASDLARRHRLTQNLVVTGWARGLLLQADARWDECEQLLEELDRLEATLAVVGTSIGVGQRAAIRERQGRLPEMLDELERMVDLHPFFREMYALALARDGRAAQARQWLGPWTEQPPLVRDYLWLTMTVVRSWVWTALEDRAAMADLRRQLLPYRDRLGAGGGSVAFVGGVSHWLGVLDAALGDTASARAHLEAARAAHERHGLSFWAGLSDRAIARLPASGRP